MFLPNYNTLLTVFIPHIRLIQAPPSNITGGVLRSRKVFVLQRSSLGLRSKSSVLQLTVGDKTLFPRRRTERDPNELEPLRPENTGLQVHRSLPAPLSRKPGRPGGRRSPDLQHRRRSRSPGYSAYSPVFELSPDRRLPAPHTHPDTWACQ